MLSVYVPYFLSAIAGGVGVGLLWWLAEQRHAAVVRDLLAEEARLSNQKRWLTLSNYGLRQHNENLRWRAEMAEEAVVDRDNVIANLDARLKPFITAHTRARRGANGKFVRAAA